MTASRRAIRTARTEARRPSHRARPKPRSFLSHTWTWLTSPAAGDPRLVVPACIAAGFGAGILTATLVS
ncbi:hypothetical protein [Isoptericola sp. NPDC055881]